MVVSAQGTILRNPALPKKLKVRALSMIDTERDFLDHGLDDCVSLSVFAERGEGERE